MRNDDICYLTAIEAAALFRKRKLSPVELLSAIIARAEQVNPKINCFADCYFDEALARASMRLLFLFPPATFHLAEYVDWDVFFSQQIYNIFLLLFFSFAPIKKPAPLVVFHPYHNASVHARGFASRCRS